MYGYDNFEATEFTTTFTDSINQKDKSLVRNIKEYLAIRCGMQEVYTYPWMNDVFVNAVLQSTDGVLKLSTPPAAGYELHSFFSSAEPLRGGCEKRALL